MRVKCNPAVRAATKFELARNLNVLVMEEEEKEVYRFKILFLRHFLMGNHSMGTIIRGRKQELSLTLVIQEVTNKF